MCRKKGKGKEEKAKYLKRLTDNKKTYGKRKKKTKRKGSCISFLACL